MKIKFCIYFFVYCFLLFSFQVPALAKDLKGAEYRTKDIYTYGRFEVRMKSANCEGMLSSFFTYFDGTESDPWAAYKWNEIDLEILGRYDDNIQFNVITQGQTDHVSHFPMSTSPHLDYHTYAFEWTPDYVAWFVDGTEVVRQTGEHISTVTRPQKIMMNVWNPLYENWAGVLDPASLPSFSYYDWVSYYSYTPGTGNYGTGNNFTHDWTDNFDYFDSTRWEKATHTFGGNGVDFIQENAVFQDGKLILCITNSTNTGFTDVTPPTILWARTNSTDKITVAFSEGVDKTDAENVSNYLITPSGVTINSATLKPDLKTVDLTVDSIDLSSSHLLVVYPIKDMAAIPNTSSTQAKSMIMSQPLSFPIKINCAGSAVSDYLPETSWNENSEYGSMDGRTRVYDSTLQITGTEEDVIYQSEIYWFVGYKVRVPNGNYNVKLMFAENYFNSPGLRIFDVYVEHNLVIENLDIISEVGKNSALVEEIPNVQVSDGVLDIDFADKVDYALINGIIITPDVTGINDKPESEPNDFKLEQNYPNPFNGSTIIEYSLQSEGNVKIKIYDVLGKLVFSENVGFKKPGEYQYKWDIYNIKKPLSSGVYFYSLEENNKSMVKKLILLN
jgi:hypothetical protein